jgi:hypothetical protein
MAWTLEVADLARKLVELTDQGKVQWQETAKENTFLTPVAKSVVIIGRVGPEDQASYHLNIANHEGTVVEEVNEFGPSTSDSYQRLKSLYESARGSAFDVRQIVAEMLSSLEQLK